MATKQPATNRVSNLTLRSPCLLYRVFASSFQTLNGTLDDAPDDFTNDANVTKRCSSHLSSNSEAGTDHVAKFSSDNDVHVVSQQSDNGTPSLNAPNQVDGSKGIKRKADLESIDTHNIITPSPQVSNHSGPSVNSKERPRKSRRLAREHGQGTVDYDMKYHPMDELLRPGFSAKRRASRIQAPGIPSKSDEETGDGNGNKALSKLVALPNPHRRRSSRNIYPGDQPIYSAKWHPLDQMLKDNASSEKGLEDCDRSKTTRKPSGSSILKDKEDLSVIASNFDSNLDADKASKLEGKIASINPNQRRSARVSSSKVEAPNYDMKYSGLTRR